MPKHNDEDRYWMRRGMAKVAMQIKAGREMRDAHNQPLSYAARMAKAHSFSTLEKFVKDKRKVTVAL